MPPPVPYAPGQPRPGQHRLADHLPGQHRPGWPRSPRSRVGVALAVVLAVGATGAGAVSAEAGDGTARGVGAATAAAAGPGLVTVRAAAPAGRVGTGPADFTVTLVTGDRVRVRTVGGQPSVQPLPGAGRRVSFATLRTPTGLEVIPSDAVPLLAADRLDRRLFDVLLLGRLGYHDAARADVPVLVSGARTLSPRPPAVRPGQRQVAAPMPRVPAARTGATSVVSLPRLGVRSARVSKARAGAFWTATTTAARGRGAAAAAAAEKVWLVGRRQTSLDRSTAQVGAPAAWRTGLTGTGVTVAVLDSGYDPTHPDLMGAVRLSKDFTASPVGVTDTVGHGTHVASIVAGRGTASAGRYAGVAKGATLAVGKVCLDEGCYEDAILAGMEWAATTAKAKVVNLSLGGPPRDGADPLVQAVDGLTAYTGTLFVIAAGNDGPSPGTVGSPGIARSALTVGSVGRTDVLSDFSSRGPQLNPDGTGGPTIKPELTAPGEGIVAARAAGTLDDAVAGGNGGRYAALSGTSMATPHVAGAAAVLAQQHPTWTAAQLKATLTATAKTMPGTVYDRGTGRLDLARATRTTVTTDTGVLDLGYFPWPNADAPTVTRTVRYTNTGTTKVALDLTADLDGPDDTDDPRGVLTLSTQRLTVPARATRSVTLTYRADRGPVGHHSGRLTARSPDGSTTLTTALGSYREPESYTLNLSAIGRDGTPRSTLFSLIDRKRKSVVNVLTDGRSRTHRLPAGDYTVITDTVEATEKFTMSARAVRLKRTTEIVVDTRRGKQLTVSVPRREAALVTTQYLLLVTFDGGGGAGTATYSTGGGPFVIPSAAPVPGLISGFLGFLAPWDTGDPTKRPTPWVYAVSKLTGDRVPADPTYRFAPGDFAEVRQTFTRPGAEEERSVGIGNELVEGIGTTYSPFDLGGLTAQTLYLAGDPGATWRRYVVSSGGSEEDGAGAELESPARKFEPGRVHHDTWGAAVLGPLLLSAEDEGMSRTGDTLFGGVSLRADAAGHLGGASSTGSTRLLRNGKEVWRVDEPDGVFADVPPAPATYRIEMENTSTLPWTTLSSRQSLAWTFRSGHVAGDRAQVLPLSVVRYAPALDLRNQAPKGRAFTVPVTVARAPGAAPAGVRSLTVEVSYDRGKTWTKAALSGTGSARTARLTHPARAGSVSLRATAVSTDGSRVDQTVIDAYTTG